MKQKIMQIPNDQKELTELFRRFGARNPESWASSQLNEGIPQLHRFLFLRQAWSEIIGDQDTSWIDYELEHAEKSPTAPWAGIGQALERCLANGAKREDVAEIVRGMQAQLLFNLCYLLEDPRFEEDELEDFGWCLVQTTGKDWEPTAELVFELHESVLETDPTGREMRPRNN